MDKRGRGGAARALLPGRMTGRSSSYGLGVGGSATTLGPSPSARPHPRRRLQRERIAAFGEYIADVKQGRFPERSHLVEMDAGVLEEFLRSPEGPGANC
jgi:hypothetical protein